MSLAHIEFASDRIVVIESYLDMDIGAVYGNGTGDDLEATIYILERLRLERMGIRDI
jgi:hypothetical protein